MAARAALREGCGVATLVPLAQLKLQAWVRQVQLSPYISICQQAMERLLQQQCQQQQQHFSVAHGEELLIANTTKRHFSWHARMQKTFEIEFADVFPNVWAIQVREPLCPPSPFQCQARVPHSFFQAHLSAEFCLLLSDALTKWIAQLYSVDKNSSDKVLCPLMFGLAL